MLINQKSVMADVLQACAGTWDVSEDNGWRCVEAGKLRLFRKICTKGSNVLPQKFLKERKEVTPVIEFRKDNISGQTLTLQQTALECEENSLCVILQF